MNPIQQGKRQMTQKMKGSFTTSFGIGILVFVINARLLTSAALSF